MERSRSKEMVRLRSTFVVMSVALTRTSVSPKWKQQRICAPWQVQGHRWAGGAHVSAASPPVHLCGCNGAAHRPRLARIGHDVKAEAALQRRARVVHADHFRLRCAEDVDRHTRD
jgi:hypothetical protein